MNFEGIWQMFENSPTKWIALSGIRLDLVEERHIRIVLPLGENMHTNHVGTAYAGSLFMAAEVASAVLFFASYGMDDFVPIVRHIDIEYVKPCTTDIVVDISLTLEDAERLIAPIRERGRGDYMMELSICNTEGEAVAKMKNNLYILPRK